MWWSVTIMTVFRLLVIQVQTHSKTFFFTPLPPHFVILRSYLTSCLSFLLIVVITTFTYTQKKFWFFFYLCPGLAKWSSIILYICLSYYDFSLSYRFLPLFYAGDAAELGLIPGSGRSPGGENSNQLQCSCQENPMDRGAWQATVHGIAKNQTWLRDWVHPFLRRVSNIFGAGAISGRNARHIFPQSVLGIIPLIGGATDILVSSSCTGCWAVPPLCSSAVTALSVVRSAPQLLEQKSRGSGSIKLHCP